MPPRPTPTFDDLYASLAPRVLALALQMTGDADLARDVLQDTFLAVHRGLKGFRGQAEASTWVYRIAINASHRVRRRRARAGSIERHAAEIRRHGMGGESDPERVERLYRALDRLSPEHREVLSLLALRDISTSAIAQVLGVPVGTVHSRCHHARERLREAMDQEGSV